MSFPGWFNQTDLHFMSKILIIDDNQDMLLTLEHLLQFYEFEVVKAENGKTGVDAAIAEQPDLIIVDALMPVMNGFEACDRLKKGPTTNHIPVIFLSANYTAPEQPPQKAMELGADDYMLKPFNAKELVNKVNSLLHRQRLLQSLRRENVESIRQRLPELPVDLTKGLDIPASLDRTTGFAGQGHPFTGGLNQLIEAPVTAAAPVLSLVVADIDQFADIEAEFGDQTADYVLVKVANLILNNAREESLVFRVQGHRFAILQPGVDELTAFTTAAHILDLIRSQPIFDEDFFCHQTGTPAPPL